MKKILLIIAFCCFANVVNAQKKPAEVVKTNFKQMFPTAQKAKFSREKDGSWEVDFKENNVKSSAKFANDGEWLETERSVKFANVPAEVQDYIKKNYVGFDIESCEEVKQKEKMTFFEIFVEKKRQNFEVLLTHDGKLIEEKKNKKAESND